jgi:uncharacterized protein (UPF0371 family)
MGVNMVGNCIIDDEVVRKAANREIIRRYYNSLVAVRNGEEPKEIVYKHEIQMKQAKISPADRPVIAAAIAKRDQTGEPAAAIELPDGRIVTGKTSALLGASSAALLNALKAIAGIDKDEDIISPDILAPIQTLKTEHLGNHNPRLHTDEVLIALSITAVNSESAKRAIEALPALRNAEVHSSVILAQVDTDVFRKLGIKLTCEPKYQTKKLFHN